MYDIERNIRNMQNDVIKLNTLLHDQKNMETSLEANNILTENDFIAGLKVYCPYFLILNNGINRKSEHFSSSIIFVHIVLSILQLCLKKVTPYF